MKKVLVLEEVTEKGSEWGISFTDHNPEAKDYFKMPDAETAQRLKSYLAEYASQQAPASTPPVSAMEDGWVKVEKDKLEKLYLISSFDSYNRCNADDNKFLNEMESFIFPHTHQVTNKTKDMEEIKKYILEKSETNGFSFYKYLHIKGGSSNWEGKGEKHRNGGEFDFILYYAMPEEVEKKPIGMCERLWCIDSGIVYGEGETINAAYKNYLSKLF